MPADADADVDPRPPSTVDVARVAADAARSHDDVVDLDAGLAGEFATYGLGGRVIGVRVERRGGGRTQVQVRLVVRFGRALLDIGDEVRSLITARLADTEPEVHVHIADIVSEDTELDHHPGAP
jgi:uncharacterized alkaline shock family protein YloU